MEFVNSFSILVLFYINFYVKILLSSLISSIFQYTSLSRASWPSRMKRVCSPSVRAILILETLCVFIGFFSQRPSYYWRLERHVFPLLVVKRTTFFPMMESIKQASVGPFNNEWSHRSGMRLSRHCYIWSQRNRRRYAQPYGDAATSLAYYLIRHWRLGETRYSEYQTVRSWAPSSSTTIYHATTTSRMSSQQ